LISLLRQTLRSRQRSARSGCWRPRRKTLRAIRRIEFTCLRAVRAHTRPSPLAATLHWKHSINTPYRIGKYTLSPLTLAEADGRYRASLSIKSGRGSQICDRVFRFAPTFDTHDEAASFVGEQAQAWLADRMIPTTSSTTERTHG